VAVRTNDIALCRFAEDCGLGSATTIRRH